MMESASLAADFSPDSTIVFSVRNLGGDTLQLDLLYVSCKCIVLEQRIEISPGELRNIELLRKSEGIQASTTYEAIYKTNVPNSPHLTLHARVSVDPNLVASMLRLNFGEVEAGQYSKLEVVDFEGVLDRSKNHRLLPDSLSDIIFEFTELRSGGSSLRCMPFSAGRTIGSIHVAAEVDDIVKCIPISFDLTIIPSSLVRKTFFEIGLTNPSSSVFIPIVLQDRGSSMMLQAGSYDKYIAIKQEQDAAQATIEIKAPSEIGFWETKIPLILTSQDGLAERFVSILVCGLNVIP